MVEADAQHYCVLCHTSGDGHSKKMVNLAPICDDDTLHSAAPVASILPSEGVKALAWEAKQKVPKGGDTR